jgi:hypothetical protein
MGVTFVPFPGVWNRINGASSFFTGVAFVTFQRSFGFRNALGRLDLAPIQPAMMCQVCKKIGVLS